MITKVHNYTRCLQTLAKLTQIVNTDKPTHCSYILSTVTLNHVDQYLIATII